MKRILEIGCGEGFTASVLSKNNDVVGIDLSRENIKVAQKRYPRVKFLTMNAEKLIFKASSFDEARAIEVLEHVDNLSKVIKEVGRVLRKGGKLVVSIPFYKSEAWLIKIRPTYFQEIHHVRVFKKNELEKFCKKYGFSLYRKEYKGFLQHIELYILFKRKNTSKTQVSIGSWRDSFFTRLVHATMLYFDPSILQTPLKYLPIWLISIPVGYGINSIGNLFFSKSIYYEFIKK